MGSRSELPLGTRRRARDRALCVGGVLGDEVVASVSRVGWSVALLLLSAGWVWCGCGGAYFSFLVLSVDTPDASTAVVTFKKPNADWQDVGGGFSGVILEKAKFTSTDVADTMRTSIGFSGGPWVLSSFDQHHEVLVANTHYWDAERIPTIRQVDFLPNESSADTARGLASGAVDVAYPQPDAGLVRSLPATRHVHRAFGVTTQYENIWFNEKPGKPFADKNLRQAFSFAFDRSKFLNGFVNPFDPTVP